MQKRVGGIENAGASAPRRRRKATMKDVADLAGVSLATVSRTLSAHRRSLAAPVAPGRGGGAAARLCSQRQRARAARQDQRPRRRPAARHRQPLLLRAAARNRGAGAQPRHGGADRRHRRRSRDRRNLLAAAWSTVSAPTASSCSMASFPLQPGKLAIADYPMVVVSERIAGLDAPIVGIDNVAAAFDVVSHLARLGHRRVAHICGPAENVLTQNGAPVTEGGRNARARALAGAIQPGDSRSAPDARDRAGSGGFAAADGDVRPPMTRSPSARCWRRRPRPEGPRGPFGRRFRRHRDGCLRSAADHVYQPRREMGRKALETWRGWSRRREGGRPTRCSTTSWPCATARRRPLRADRRTARRRAGPPTQAAARGLPAAARLTCPR